MKWRRFGWATLVLGALVAGFTFTQVAWATNCGMDDYMVPQDESLEGLQWCSNGVDDPWPCPMTILVTPQHWQCQKADWEYTCDPAGDVIPYRVEVACGSDPVECPWGKTTDTLPPVTTPTGWSCPDPPP